jgi:formiminoglutamase
MLSHWLTPISADQITATAQTANGALGRQIDFYTGAEKKLPKGGVILLGLDAQVADAVRNSLYAFASPDTGLRITDLGNFRKSESDFCIPLIQELLSAGHILVLLGKSEETAVTQFLAYRDFKRVSNMALIHQQLRLEVKEAINAPDCPMQSILLPQHKRLFHFALLGTQAHLMQGQVLRYMEKKGFDHIRLGSVRQDPSAVEPAIRDMDLVAANLQVLRTGVHQYQTGTASGLTVEEFCLLARYAGISEKVTSLSLAGLCEREAPSASFLTEAAAQFLWYFLEGVAQRHQDFPVSVNEMTEYIVDLQKLAYRLTFWRSNKSGRWWVQVPVQIEKNKERHRLVPCTYNDYQLASKEELSDRLVRAFERFM